VQHFDVVVVGREIAGLVAGALLAKSGQRVLHLDPGVARSTYKYKDLTFHRNVLLLGAWDGTPAQKRALFELNLISDLSKRLIAADPPLQVVWPDHRVDIRRDIASLAGELNREWPGSGDSAALIVERITELNEQLDKILDGRAPLTVDSWSERRRLKRYLGEHPMPSLAELFPNGGALHPLARISSYAARFLSGLDPSQSNAACVLRAAQRMVDGFFTLPAGVDDIADRLIGVIKSFHGASREDDIADVTTAWRRGIVSLTLEHRDVIGCDHIIGAEPAARLFQRFPEKLMSRAYERRLAEIVPRQRVYTMNVALRAAGVPEAMGPVGFFVRDPGRALVEDNFLLWHLSPPGKELRALTLAAIIDDADSRDRVYWRSLRTRVLAALDELAPFSASYTDHVDVPWDDGEREDPRPTAEMTPLYHFEGEATLGLTALPHETPVKNVLLANRQILPGLGLEGEFLAGLAVARALRSTKDEPSWAEH
jgi:hypothetical protein